MKATKYLFNIEPEELDSLLYWDALKYKKQKGYELFKRLYLLREDDERMFWVNKAREHTDKLLKERDGHGNNS